MAESVIADGLVKLCNTDPKTATTIARRSEGDFNNALQILNHDSEDLIFEKWFLYWVRTAFKAKGNKMAINDLLSWSEEVAASGRETQKKFLSYCLDFFRDALLVNYNAQDLVFYQAEDPTFNIHKFAPFIHEGNILPISDQVSEALYHVERNGNAKIIFADLAIVLTRLIHKKAV